MMKDKFLTLKQVAKRLLVSERTILRYIHSKKIVAVKVGYWRISERELEKFIKARTNIKPRKRKKKII